MVPVDRIFLIQVDFEKFVVSVAFEVLVPDNIAYPSVISREHNQYGSIRTSLAFQNWLQEDCPR
jgi:flagellar biogenesis protein FliO